MTYVTFPAQTVRHSLLDASDASIRAFTLQSEAAANRSRPLRTPPDVVSVYRTNPTQWTQCVHGQPAANRSRTVRASGKIVSAYTALVMLYNHCRTYIIILNNFYAVDPSNLGFCALLEILLSCLKKMVSYKRSKSHVISIKNIAKHNIFVYYSMCECSCRHCFAKDKLIDSTLSDSLVLLLCARDAAYWPTSNISEPYKFHNMSILYPTY